MAKIKTRTGHEIESEDKAISIIATKKVKPRKGKNTILSHEMSIAYLEKIDNHDPIQVKERTLDYFLLCQQNDVKPSIAGYALSLGTSRNVISHWQTGSWEQNEEVMAIINKAYSVINAIYEDTMAENSQAAVNLMFLLKNNFGYTDKSEVVISPQKSMSAEELIESAKLLPE